VPVGVTVGAVGASMAVMVPGADIAPTFTCMLVVSALNKLVPVEFWIWKEFCELVLLVNVAVSPCRFPARYSFRKVSVLEPRSIELVVPGNKLVFMATAAKLLKD
jgi:hypothetical protein